MKLTKLSYTKCTKSLLQIGIKKKRGTTLCLNGQNNKKQTQKQNMGKRSEQWLHKKRLSSVRQIWNKVYDLITNQISANQNHNEILPNTQENGSNEVTDSLKCWQGCGGSGTLCTAGKLSIAMITRKSLASPTNGIVHVPYHPNLLLGRYPMEMHIFAKNYMQTIQMSTLGWINKTTAYTFTVEINHNYAPKGG